MLFIMLSIIIVHSSVTPFNTVFRGEEVGGYIDPLWFETLTFIFVTFIYSFPWIVGVIVLYSTIKLINELRTINTIK